MINTEKNGTFLTFVDDIGCQTQLGPLSTQFPAASHILRPSPGAGSTVLPDG